MKLSEEKKAKAVKSTYEDNSGLWNTILKSITRPKRFSYSPNQLPYCVLTLTNNKYTRRQTTVYHNDKALEVSIYDPQVPENKIILYLHGNSSSRFQCLSLLKFLPSGYSLAGFDFMGCGINYEEDMITLGFSESEQVRSVVNYLTSKQQNYEVILWGRSMGAVSALKYGKAKIIIADSPFTSARQLFRQISGKEKKVPNCLISCLFPCIFWKLKSDIKKRAKYDLDDLNIKKAVRSINPNTSLIFLTGNNDTLIDKYHSNELYRIFKGKSKYLEVVKGNHNDRRPESSILKIMGMIEELNRKNQSQMTCEGNKEKYELEQATQNLTCSNKMIRTLSTKIEQQSEHYKQIQSH